MDDVFKWFSGGDNLKGLGTLVGGLGGAWGALEQSKNAKAMLNLQTNAYDDEKKRRDAYKLALEKSFAIPKSSVSAPVASLPLGA